MTALNPPQPHSAPWKGQGVLFVLDSSPPSWTGVEEFHYRLASRLKQSGAQPVILYAHMPPEAVRDRMAASGAVIMAANYYSSIPRFHTVLTRIIRQYRVELVQIRHFNYFRILPWLPRLAGVRNIVFTEGNSGYFRTAGWKMPLFRLRTRLVTWPVTHAVGVSGFVKDQLAGAGMNGDRISVIHNGADLERFRPDPKVREKWRQRLNVRPEELLLSTVSWLHRWKNPQVIVQACGRLARRGVPFRLIVAGDGEMREELQLLSRTLEIADRITWLGYYPQPNEVLQAADVFLLASVGEACANALLEAMACGLPIVASQSGGTPELVADGQTGILVPPMDAFGFADAVETLAHQPRLRLGMSENARERARRHFTADMPVERYMELYGKLIT